jgi:hypothetical protein
MVGYGGNDAVFEGVARGQPEDADGFYADVLVGGGVEYGGIGIVGDSAGEDVGGAAAGVGYADQWDIDVFEGAVVVEIEAGELADAEFGIDFDDAVDFLAGVAVGLEADFGFEEVDLGGGGRGGGFVGRLLGVNGKGDNEKKKGQECGADVSVTGRSWGHERIVAWDLLGARNGNGKRSSTEGTEAKHEE